MAWLYPTRGRRLQLLVQFGSAMALALFGWDAGIIGGVVDNPAFIKSINFDGDVPMITFCVAGILLGDIVGCLVAIPFVYRVGRRLCIIAACWVGPVGVILQSSTFSATQMIIGRVLLGLGNGAISAIVPAFVQESAVGTEQGKSQDKLITVGYGVLGIAAANWLALVGGSTWSAVNVIIFYSASIFEELGLGTDTTNILTASLQSAAPVGMISAWWLLPRFGRKPLLILGGAGQLAMMVVFTILSNLGSKTTSSTQWGAVACLYIYQTISGCTWLWMPYLYCVEIIPTKYRGQVISAGNAMFWLIAFIEVYAAPIALDRATGAKIFIWFCLGGAFMLSVVVALAKETKGLSLEQIDLLWASEEYKTMNHEAQIIEHASAEKGMESTTTEA